MLAARFLHYTASSASYRRPTFSYLPAAFPGGRNTAPSKSTRLIFTPVKSYSRQFIPTPIKFSAGSSVGSCSVSSHSHLQPASEGSRPPAGSLVVAVISDSGCMETITFSKPDLLAAIPKLDFRDFRTVDSSSARQISAILVRENCIIAKLEHLRAIITAKKVYLLEGDKMLIQTFAAQLHSSLAKPSSDPFEFRVLEGLLAAATYQFEMRLQLVESVVAKVLERVETPKFPFEEAMIRLLPMRRCIGSFTTAVKEMRSALEDVLKSDEDLSQMYLTHKLVTGTARPLLDHQQAELLCENFAKKTEELNNELTQMADDINASEHLVQMTLDATRNRLLFLSTQISIVGVPFAIASSFASLFGMNLINGFEMNPKAFWIVTGCIVLAGAVAYGTFAYQFMKSRLSVRELSKNSHANEFFDNVNSPEFVQSLHDDLRIGEFNRILEKAVGRKLSEKEANDLFVGFDQDHDGRLNAEDLNIGFTATKKSPSASPHPSSSALAQTSTTVASDLKTK